MTKINVSLLSALFVLLLFFSCDKESINKEFGQYAVAVNYRGDEFKKLQFFIDGKECGELIPVPNVNASHVQDCRTLKKSKDLVNVFVERKVLTGKHVLEIKTEGGTLLKTLNFEMINRECVFQKIDLVVNQKRSQN